MGMARYPIGCGSSSVRGMLLSVSKCRILLSVLSFSLSHSVGYTSVGWLGRDSDSILYNTNSSRAPTTIHNNISPVIVNAKFRYMIVGKSRDKKTRIK